jgi:hypothetical protein
MLIEKNYSGFSQGRFTGPAWSAQKYIIFKQWHFAS